MNVMVIGADMKKILSTGLSWLWISVLVIILDILTKSWVATHLAYFESVRVLPFFNLTLAYNTGAAFNFLHNASGWQNFLFGGLAGVISILILYWLYQLPAKSARLMNIGLALTLGGALGNALDRLLYGHVIDFLDFHLGNWHFAIFNVADSAISVGAFLMIVYWLCYDKKS